MIFNDGFNMALTKAMWYVVPYEVIIVPQKVRSPLAAEAFDVLEEDQLFQREEEQQTTSSIQPILKSPCRGTNHITETRQIG